MKPAGTRATEGSAAGIAKPSSPKPTPAAGSAFEGTHYELERSPILTPVASIESGAAAAMARPLARAAATATRNDSSVTGALGGGEIGASLRNPQALRQAFLLTEILAPPAADRFGAGGAGRAEA